MGQSAPRVHYGIHSASPYRRDSGVPYGELRIVGGSTLAVSGELNKLNGGSSKFPWSIEDGLMTAEMTLKIKEFPDFVKELFAGKAPTANASESGGAVSAALANKKGTSAVAATGLTTVTIGADPTKIKFGKYVVEVASATTVDVYLLSDVDINRGSDTDDFIDDTLKIAAGLTITMGGTTALPGDFNLDLNGGGGTIAMVVGDTATFEIRPPNSGSTDVLVGGRNDKLPEFGILIVAEKLANGEMVELDVFRCRGTGLPHQFDEKTFAEAEIPVEAMYDSARNAVYSMRTVKPLTAC